MDPHIVLSAFANISYELNILPTNNVIADPSSGRIIDAYARIHLFSPARIACLWLLGGAAMRFLL